MDTSTSTQSHDVTVGEVDTLNDIPGSPRTGMFSLEISKESAILAGAIILPIIIISIFLVKHVRHK